MTRQIVALLGIFLFVVFSVHQASSRHPRQVAVIWYGFSLALTGTLLVGLWAEHTGAIDSSGFPQGDEGKLVLRAFNFFLDLNGEVTIIVGFLALLILPQFISYVLSGLSGCAWDLYLLREASKYAYIFIVKSFATVSVILTGLVIIGLISSWKQFIGTSILLCTVLGLTLIAGCFAATDPFTSPCLRASDWVG